MYIDENQKSMFDQSLCTLMQIRSHFHIFNFSCDFLSFYQLFLKVILKRDCLWSFDKLFTWAANTCVNAKSVLQSLQHSSYDIILKKSGWKNIVTKSLSLSLSQV